MNSFVRNLITEWRRLDLPFNDKTIVVGLSGGADSVSLILALYELRKMKKLNLRLVAAHFNHNLRGEESEKDAEFVKNLAFEFDFELALGKADIQREGNLEQNARVERYKFLAQTAENLHAFGVLTAHTLNDQAETLLINLMRGSGLEGLGGMKSIRTLESEIVLIRPLLTWATREMTENFCRSNEVEYRYDTMNEDLAFRRVRVRKVLLPLLEDFNPKIIDILAKTAFRLQEDYSRLESAVDNESDNNELSVDETELSLRKLIKLSDSSRLHVLREWLKARRGDLRNLDSKHFGAIERLILSRKSGKTVELPNGEILIKEKGKLRFSETKVEKSPAAN